MSKVGGGGGGGGGFAFMRWGVIYIHSEYIWHRLLVFNTFFITTSNFGGAQPPLIKKWGGGGSIPPAPPPPPPPGSLAMDNPCLLLRHDGFHDI